ncbi:hypothetical protein [Chromobacterium sp. IIBBL 290-4]|uniref:hypothetical protein n=1 Tax=Chromobacterium sp. IIBBL 290-4 TaxID=2953890 RepID=UPI0020B83F47|nr:hypothetical protein [Chromobacterium sp. IIBBL 290-4]UTH74083.1 hypothetical protein NKT35_21460 [Chromobacterium sp. IIBBL 290-4]
MTSILGRASTISRVAFSKELTTLKSEGHVQILTVTTIGLFQGNVMNLYRILLAGLALQSTICHADDFSLLAFGASDHHGCTTCHLNESNPGAGLEWAFSGDDDQGRWFTRAGSYRDSFRKTAYFGAVGWRKEWQVAGPATLGIGLQGGYLDGSGRHGLAALPFISIGFRKVALEVGYLPKVTVGDHHAKTSVTTFNLRWTF